MENERNNEDGEIVSMRCLRHKRRFNVERDWIDTCQWLCPQCHAQLSDDERESYRPKSGVLPDVREPEEGKATMYPKFTLKAMLPIVDADEIHVSEHRVKSEKKLAKNDKPVRQIKSQRPNGRVSDNPAFRGLLPRFRIQCQRCGDIAPCHYSWFDTSTVLCPKCYSEMGKTMIDLFHSKHKADKPAYVENGTTLYSGSPVKVFPPKKKKRGRPKVGSLDNDDLRSLEGWSNERIMSASEAELNEAVKLGVVSGVRMRIELRRRNNLQYYNMMAMPDMEKSGPIF